MTEEKIPQNAGFVNVFILHSCRMRLFMITLQKTKHGVQSTKYRVQSTKYRVQSSELPDL